MGYKVITIDKGNLISLHRNAIVTTQITEVLNEEFQVYTLGSHKKVKLYLVSSVWN